MLRVRQKGEPMSPQWNRKIGEKMQKEMQQGEQVKVQVLMHKEQISKQTDKQL